MEILIGTIFIITLGTFNHFIYDLLGKNKFIGYFASINESTWEHIKLAFWPSIFWLFIEFCFYKTNPNIFNATFLSILAMVILIPLFYYSLKYLFKKSYLIIDILIYYISIFIGRYIFYIIINLKQLPNYASFISLAGLIIMIIIFLTFTYNAPKNFLFKDPITGKYGE